MCSVIIKLCLIYKYIELKLKFNKLFYLLYDFKHLINIIKTNTATLTTPNFK